MKHLIIILGTSTLVLQLSCSTLAIGNNLSVGRPSIIWYDEGNYLKITKNDAVKLMQYINLLEVNNGGT